MSFTTPKGQRCRTCRFWARFDPALDDQNRGPLGLCWLEPTRDLEYRAYTPNWGCGHWRPRADLRCGSCAHHPINAGDSGICPRTLLSAPTRAGVYHMSHPQALACERWEGEE